MAMWIGQLASKSEMLGVAGYCIAVPPKGSAEYAAVNKRQ